ncbi:hypothetical protein [Pseudomonas sp. PSKL.D1]|uniref:hypothetical protein n=1 Tax=Pseudomonas sp. PSKL.D1 TaxID=3029060 RepID=UPI002381625E|nr:hypothetical protein [Pseudomonas sp. PSKL.D1]WDY60396.1 hypothetical protein PVV54_12445 [Pseudomonas sp. PSKL.D1]
MATVPTYQRQVSLQGLPQVRVSPQMVDTSAIQQGLDAVGNVATDMAVRQRQEADTTAIINADNKLTEWQNNTFYNQQNGVYTRKGQNALDVTGQTLGDFDKFQEELGAGLANDTQRKRYAQLVAQRRQSMSNDLNRYEYGQHQQYMNDVDDASIKLSTDSAALNYGDPSKVGLYRQKALDVIESQAQRNGWSPEKTELEKINASSRLLTGVIAQMADSNPQRAQQYYEASKDGMNAETQVRVSNMIDQGIRRQQAEARQRQVEARQLQAISRVELQSRVQDAQSAYLQGLEFENPPSRADFDAAYGDKGGQAYESFAKVQAVAPAMRELATAGPEDRQKILDQFNPASGGKAGEGFTQDEQLYRRLQTVDAGLMKQRQTDPAAYAATYSAPVREAFAAAQQAGTPEAYRAYADATFAEQRRLGVHSPKLLPDAAADQIAAGFNARVAGGENAATLIEQQQAQWGNNFPMIAQQLGKKLPSEAQVIATQLPKDLAERMAAVASLSEDDLKKGLSEGVSSNVASAVQTAMGPFGQSLQGQSGGIETFNTMYNAAYKTALAYVRQGDDPQKAAQRVVNGMVNDKYDFFDTYRVPKSLNTAAVKRGADLALESMAADDFMPMPGILGVTDSANAEQLRQAVVDGGQWVPNNDESGLSLTINGYRLLDKDGKPITRTWDELTTRGLSQPESNASRIGRVRGLGINN